MPSLIRAFSARKVLTERKCKAAAETDSRDEGGPRSGGRVLTFIKSPIFESFSTCSDVAGLLCWNPVRHATSSDSDTGTQMIKGPFRRRWRQLPLTGTPCYTVLQTDIPQRGRHITLFVEPAIFTPKIISNTELTTVSGFCPESLERVSDARRKKES